MSGDYKQYALVPIESQELKFDGLTFMSQNLEDVLVVKVPENSIKDEVLLLRDKLVIAFPDRTIVVLPDSVEFCKVKEVCP